MGDNYIELIDVNPGEEFRLSGVGKSLICAIASSIPDEMKPRNGGFKATPVVVIAHIEGVCSTNHDMPTGHIFFLQNTQLVILLEQTKLPEFIDKPKMES